MNEERKMNKQFNIVNIKRFYYVLHACIKYVLLPTEYFHRLASINLFFKKNIL